MYNDEISIYISNLQRWDSNLHLQFAAVEFQFTFPIYNDEIRNYIPIYNAEIRNYIPIYISNLQRWNWVLDRK